MEQKNHGSPSFINIVVLLLFAVVIAVASSVTTYFFLSSGSNEQYSATQPPVIPQTQTNVQPTSAPIETTTVSDETANWKIYKNEKYGFEVKYPPSWYLYQPENTSGVGFWIQKTEGEASGVWVNINSNPNNLSLQEWWLQNIKQYADQQNLLNKTVRKEKSINGYNAYTVQTSQEWYSRPFTDSYIKKEDKIYEIHTNSTDFYGEGIFSVYNQILSTFKFIE